MEEYEEILVDFDGTDAEVAFEIQANPKGVQFNAVCLNHNRSITGWVTDNAQIVTAIYYHRRSNPGHSIRVFQRIK